MKFAHLSGCHHVCVTSYRQNQMGISIKVSRLIVCLFYCTFPSRSLEIPSGMQCSVIYWLQLQKNTRVGLNRLRASCFIIWEPQIETTKINNTQQYATCMSWRKSRSETFACIYTKITKTISKMFACIRRADRNVLLTDMMNCSVWLKYDRLLLYLISLRDCGGNVMQ